MEKLVVPNGLYAQMRLPRYKNLLADTPYYRSIGIENDSFFGKIPDRGYGTGGLDAGTEQWDQLMREAAYAPQDGELYWHFWFEQNPGMTVHAARRIAPAFGAPVFHPVYSPLLFRCLHCERRRRKVRDGPLDGGENFQGLAG